MKLEKYFDSFLRKIETPIGLFIGHSEDARLVVSLCHSRGLRVPQDVAVLCLHTSRIIVDEPPPKISYVDGNFTTIGYEAAKLLEQMMDGEPPPEEPVLIEPKGVVGQASTDYLAVEDETVAKAMRYISSHIDEPLVLGEIADATGVSRRKLQAHFAKYLGTSVSNEIRRLRIARAKRLLVEPGWQVQEAARASGFGSPHAMCYVFNREVGLSPSEYRKKMLGE